MTLHAFPLALGLGLSLAACGSQPASPLGVAAFEINETATAVTIVGRSARGELVGRADLTLGRFELDDIEAGRRYEVDGRKLVVSIDGTSSTSETIGYERRVLPVPGDAQHASLSAFLLDPHVAAVLARHALFFEAKEAAPPTEVASTPAETAYDQNCWFGTSSACGSPTQCVGFHQSADGDCQPSEEEYVCCPTSHQAVYRSCNLGLCAGPVGPNGCSVCWAYTYSTSCTTSVSGTPRVSQCSPYEINSWPSASISYL